MHSDSWGYNNNAYDLCKLAGTMMGGAAVVTKNASEFHRRGGESKMASPSQSPRAALPGSPRARAARDEDETCTVCLEPHKEPRVLPCLHVFCTKCLQRLLNEIGGGENLVCPNCRAECDPPLNAEEFPPDHAGQLSTELGRTFCEAEDEKGGPCKNCEEEGKTDAYCGDCGGGICQGCVQLHQRMKVFRDHKYTAWTDLSERNFKHLHRRQLTCRFHELAIQLFCEKCNRFICSLCLKETHSRHIESAKALEEVSAARRAEVKRLSDEAEKQFCVLESRLTELAQMEGGLANYPQSLELSITSTFEQYMQQIKLYCDQTLNEAHQRCMQMTKGLQSQKTDTEIAMEKLKTGIRFSKRADTCTNDDEIIEMSGLAINQLSSTMKEQDISPLKRPLVFEKGELKLGRLREIREGDINVEPPQFCFMNSENWITVKFLLPINTRPILKILYGSQKHRLVCRAPNEPIETACTLDFVPRCAGKHTIEVWVGGVMCKRCDDVMMVRGAPENASAVKPGPDWRGGGHVTRGTVLSTEQMELPRGGLGVDGEEESFKVKVQWNTGDIIEYEWGNNDEYELELYLD